MTLLLQNVVEDSDKKNLKVIKNTFSNPESLKK